MESVFSLSQLSWSLFVVVIKSQLCRAVCVCLYVPNAFHGVRILLQSVYHIVGTQSLPEDISQHWRISRA